VPSGCHLPCARSTVGGCVSSCRTAILRLACFCLAGAIVQGYTLRAGGGVDVLPTTSADTHASRIGP